MIVLTFFLCPTDPLITRVLILARPNDEQFKVRHWELLPGLEDPFPSELEQYEKEKKEEEKKKAVKKKKK